MSGKLTNEEFLERLKQVHGNNIITLDEYKGMSIKIRFQCNKGHVWLAEPHNVLRGSECPYCSGKAVLVGFNDLWTVRPDIAKLLKNPDDGYKYVKSSHVFVDFRCPNCGAIINKSINDVYCRGLSCRHCSDGVSYPNKFARAFLDQLPIINCDYEYHPDWAKPYFYDNYFEYNNQKYILEMDGGFHFREVKSFYKSLEERQNIDIIKNNLAIKNGIKIIRINCVKSECDYIKNNILLSDLNNIFDLSNIDWQICDKKAQKSLVKQACDLYSSGIKNLNEIANILCVNKTTAQRYVKKGSKLGLCNYDPRIASKESGHSRAINVVVTDIDGKINVFKSIRECQNQIKMLYGIGITRKTIRNSCQTHKPYKGFNFRFLNDTIQNYN